MYNSYLYLEPEDKASVKKLVASAKQVNFKPKESFSDVIDLTSEGETPAKPSVQVVTAAKKTVKSKESSSDIENKQTPGNLAAVAPSSFDKPAKRPVACQSCMSKVSFSSLRSQNNLN